MAVIALVIIGWIFIGVAGALAFDKLIRLEYSRLKADWERDGEPFGTFGTPPVL